MSYLYLFEDQSIKIEAEFKNKSKETFTYNLKFVTHELLKYLYKKRPDWVSIKAWWNNSGSSIGVIYNNEKSYELKNKIIGKHDWIYFCDDDKDMLAIVYFKKSDLKIDFQIKKSDLVNNFVSCLYARFGNEWDKFDVFFSDTGNIAYADFKNTQHRKNNPRISPSTLYHSFIKLKKESFTTSNYFYCIYFTNKPFFKIGYTTNFRFRLFNYLYPTGDQEKNFADGIIDFEKSLVIKHKKASKIESKIKKKYRESIYKNSELTSQNFREIIDKEDFDKVSNYLKSKSYHLNNLKELLEHENSEQLKNDLANKNLPKTATAFFKDSRNKHFLNNLNSKIKP